MRCEIVRRAEALSALAPAWTALWRASVGRPATMHPAWVLGWWRAEGGASGEAGGFDSELLSIACWQGHDLVGLAPLFVAPPRGGSLRTRELRLCGDSVVGVGQMILAAPGNEGRVRDVVAEALAGQSSWDLLDLTLSARPLASRVLSPAGGDAEALALRFAAMGRAVERSEARGRPSLDLQGPLDRSGDPRRPLEAESDLADTAEWDPSSRAEATAALARLLAEAAAAGRPPDHRLAALIAEVAEPLGQADAAALGLLRRKDGRVAAAALVLRDGDRRMELCRLGDDPRASERLAALALRRAVDEGASRYEFSADTHLARGRAAGVRLRVLSPASASVFERGYATLMRRAVSVADSAVARVRGPIDTLRGLRDSGPITVGRVVARVATFSRLHLYRGDLFVTSGSAPLPAFATLRQLTLADFEGFTRAEQVRFLERLELVEGYCRQKWERGDLVVAAFHASDPVGILWCARGPVFVPDIGREVKPAQGERYIHDVYVAPDARGRAVAPAMLEFLARELRGSDVYRAWALIARSNGASTRAFQKASWASVADVIYARMGTTSRLLVSPPDQEARKLLGLLRI